MDFTRDELRTLHEVQGAIIVAKDDEQSDDGKVRITIELDRGAYIAMHFIEIPKP